MTETHRDEQRPLQVIVNDCFSLVRASTIAKACGISRAAVYQWRRIPIRHLKTVAQLTGFTAAELRPDLADVLRDEEG